MLYIIHQCKYQCDLLRVCVRVPASSPVAGRGGPPARGGETAGRGTAAGRGALRAGRQHRGRAHFLAVYLPYNRRQIRPVSRRTPRGVLRRLGQARLYLRWTRRAAGLEWRRLEGGRRPGSEPQSCNGEKRMGGRAAYNWRYDWRYDRFRFARPPSTTPVTRISWSSIIPTTATTAMPRAQPDVGYNNAILENDLQGYFQKRITLFWEMVTLIIKKIITDTGVLWTSY